MPSISIEIPTNFDKRILDSLESIRSQSFQDYEVIIVTTDENVKELIEGFDVKLLLAPSSGTFLRRIIAHNAAKGDSALLIEASRMLEKNCLRTLSETNHDMLIIEERDIGTKLIAKIQNIEKNFNSSEVQKFSPDSLIAEPRFFNSVILDKVFQKTRLIDKNLLSKIQFGDLDIIYYESYLISKDLHVIKNPLIYHYTDQNIFQLARKYYNYGKSNKVIKSTPYGKIFKSSNHLRPYYGLTNSALVYSLWMIKATSFFSGMYFSRGLPNP